MNTPPSDVNENIVDIFVLGGSLEGSSQIRDHLEQKGYRVTPFSGSAHLLETLQSGKPNLLICDATSGESDVFQLCQQIKTDENLWMIPVLVVTAVSNLGDLLWILDSNADEFISYPYDSRYLLSLAEGMLTTPVERVTPDQITTQFKVQHDDRIYVVTADRRKLLEFLLSSFEIAVDRSAALAQVTAEAAALFANLKKAKETVVDHSRTIDSLNAVLQKKEEREKTLSVQLEDQNARISGQDAEITRLSRDLDETQSLLASAKENIQTLQSEREETARAHQSATEANCRKISDITVELESLRPRFETSTSELATVKTSLEQETAKNASLAGHAEELARQNEGLEERLITLDAERSKALAALDEEKNRAFVAEENARLARQTGAESEAALNRKISTIEEELSLRSADLNRLTSLLEAETTHSADASARIQALEQEHEESEAILRSNVVTVKQQLADLQAEYDSTVAALDSEEQKTKILETDLAAAVNSSQKADGDLRSISGQLMEARVTLESDRARIKYLEEELSASTAARQESETSLTSLSGALDDSRAALDREKELHRISAESMNDRVRELEIAQQTLKTDRNAFQSDLESAIATRTDLEARIARAENKSIDLESDRAAVSEELKATYEQVQSLTGELQQIRSELDTERRLRRDAEEKETSFAAVREQYESALGSEKDYRIEAENGLRGQITALNTEYSIVLAQRKSLEEQVADLHRESEEKKTAADQKIAALVLELQHARTALADEWENHMNANERLSAAFKEEQNLHQNRSQMDPVTSIVKSDPGALVSVIPDPHFHAPVDRPEIHEVSDSEEVPGLPTDEEQGGIDHLFEPAPETPNPSPQHESPFELSSDESSTPYSDEDSSGTDDNELEESMNPAVIPGTPAPRGNQSFNRQQWFDLLRWARHADSITQDQRMQIVRMGRLIQRGRKLTIKQEEQIREMLVLAYSLGFRIP